jgi:hypothetical protein
MTLGQMRQSCDMGTKGNNPEKPGFCNELGGGTQWGIMDDSWNSDRELLSQENGVQ